MSDPSNDLVLQDNSRSVAQYIQKQDDLIRKEFKLQKKLKSDSPLENVNLLFICRSLPNSKSRTRVWAITMPLPANLIQPDYLLINDPAYVNQGDGIGIKFVDEENDEYDESTESDDYDFFPKNKRKKEFDIEGDVKLVTHGEVTALFYLDAYIWEDCETVRKTCYIRFLPNRAVFQRKL